MLVWVAYPFSRGSSWPKNWTQVSFIAGGFFTNWAIREALLDIYFLWLRCKSWDRLGIYILKGLVLKSLIKPQLKTNWWPICQVMCKVFTKVKDLEIPYDLGHQAGKIFPCLTLRCPKAGPQFTNSLPLLWVENVSSFLLFFLKTFLFMEVNT